MQDAPSNTVTPENQIIVVSKYFDETAEDVDDKLARWRDGEDVRDILSVEPTDGDELVIFLQRFSRA